MEKYSKISLLYFIITISILILLFSSFWINHDFIDSILATFITWSLYILCIPAYHGKIILGVPYEIINGKKLLYPERIIWPIALIFNLIIISYDNKIYNLTITTQLFYQILSTPWPKWIIIFISAIGTFYRSIIGYKKFFEKKFLHYLLRTIFVILGIFIFIYLSYNEFIILFNVMV